MKLLIALLFLASIVNAEEKKFTIHPYLMGNFADEVTAEGNAEGTYVTLTEKLESFGPGAGINFDFYLPTFMPGSGFTFGYAYELGRNIESEHATVGGSPSSATIDGTKMTTHTVYLRGFYELPCGVRFFGGVNLSELSVNKTGFDFFDAAAGYGINAGIGYTLGMFRAEAFYRTTTGQASFTEGGVSGTLDYNANAIIFTLGMAF